MMAADKEQAKKSGEKEEVVKEEKPKTINHNDHYSIKRVLDDAVSEVVLGRGYEENVNLSNVKMAIGLITCAIALAAQFYPKKFPENKTFLIGCIILYVIFNGLLQYIIITREKQHILFTYALKDSFSTTGLALSSKLPRYSDLYTLRIESSDPQSIAAHPPVEFTKSVTKWFTKSGVFLECVFWDDVEKLVDGYNSDIKESRKSK
ncbi:signal peptidase complex subunit 2 [Marchantia polymorpha subsp. ruderalis]|uniref:Signal peptidase complex subunit 2 n=2 Tax=Marchantia polymorpha TaxID=3197 RepID=A0AAF6AM82_MARPO|nr:hypothetical protein MARPO_0043s0045 [Marchantia polymorpha]BBM97552.1 hypothetical protein Mp_1g06520 [Marchantia polymorpha subsp. ruderalis]|eukprot:PTQ39794.1 hypothetical protein MARPO_0043s0045 [Marchantia polymorpha]